MKKTAACLWVLFLALPVFGQGNNTGNGGPDGDYRSLSQRILNLEKKNDQFNLFLNFAAGYQLENLGEAWESAFRARHLRVEMKGQFGEHLSYRIRHHLNSSQQRSTFEQFSRATDVMMVGWKFNDRFTLYGGKLCQYLGGIEYDINPMFIYQYSETISNIDCFQAGVALSFTPWRGQEFVFNITNAYTDRFAEVYPLGVLEDGTPIEAAHHPLSYIFNWNGTLFNGRVETRWSLSTIQQAKGFRDNQAFLGTKLKLSRLQVFFDWMGSREGLDRLQIASRELGRTGYLTQVHYDSFILNARWRFAPGWELYGQGMYETAAVPGLGRYRTATGYIGSLEYYPVKDQDLRVCLAYVGRNYRYSAESALAGRQTHRIEIGLMYRIKAY